MSKCTITFDNNPLGVYYAGQMVSGTAELITTRPKTIRSIFINVSGYAEVRWTETISKQNAEGKSENAIETFSASEVYYNSENHVYGQSGGVQIDLPPGRYAFPFQATISPNAPTSFNGAWGQILHEVTLVIDRVMRYNNTFKQRYSVISPYDLNLNPDHARPLHQIEEKIICWGLCCGGKGPIVMKVNVPFSAYASGQKVRFGIVVDNQSDLPCSDVKVRLMKKVTYTSRSPESKTQVTEMKIADNHCGGVDKHNKAEYNEFLQLPSTTPSSLASCSLIKVEYTLKFIAKVSRIFGDLVIEFPFTIGTVPLYASANDQGPITTQPGSGPSYRPLPPPMFEEDIHSEQFESNTFKPRYPVFLSDPNPSNGVASNNVPTGGNLYPTPMQPPISNNIYPSPMPAANVPTSYVSQPVKPVPTPIPAPAPAPAPIHEPAPMPSAPPTSNNQNTPQLAPQPTNDPIEVLGFSIPPDYQPTQGWK